MTVVKCINNDGHEASLIIDKYYKVIPDKFADKSHTLKLIDETGESYYYSKSYFTQYPTAA